MLDDRTSHGSLPISVVVPTRNAANWVESCLVALRAADPAEIIVVDGSSTDGTTGIAGRLADRIVDDKGRGVAAARQLGVTMASQEWVMLVDADVVVEPDTLARLLAETQSRDLDGLQAGLRSVGEGDYWSEALAEHHNGGHVRNWFGVCATLVRRDLLLRHPLDEAFRSGEDVDLRLRLESAGEPIGVSEDVVVRHRFARGFDYARAQFIADGAGLGRLVRRHGPTAVPRALLPFGAALLGILGLVIGRGRLVPYWLALAVYNGLGIVEGLTDTHVTASPNPGQNRAEAGEVPARLVVFDLAAGLAVMSALLGLEAAGILPGLGRVVRTSAVPAALTAVVAIGLVAAELAGWTGETTADRSPRGRLVRLLLLGAFLVVVLGGIRFAYIVGLLA